MTLPLIPQGIQDRYKNILGEQVQATFYQVAVQWLRKVKVVGQFGNTETNQYTYQDLLVLMEYNIKRTWPLNTGSPSGEEDKESMSMLITFSHLNDLNTAGLNTLNANGYMNFDPVADRFIHKGIIYKSTADTFTTQAFNDDLKIMLVLERQLNEVASSFTRYNG